MIERPRRVPNLDAVLLDNHQAARTAVEHMLQKGHAQNRLHRAQARRPGGGDPAPEGVYPIALEQAGLSPRPDWVRLSRLWH
jgi:DNA-binding LacI/PurR family transcriptional regulator